MTPLARILSVAAALTLAASAVQAQMPPDPNLEDAQQAPPQQGPIEPPPGHLAAVDGSVALERANQSEDAVNGMPLLIGDRLRADSGHAEVMWARGALLRLGRYTDLDVLSKSMIRLTRGRITVTIQNLPGQVVNEQLAIDAPGASVRFYSAGVYHISVTGDEEPEVRLSVTRGSAQLISDAGQIQLADAEASEVKGGGMPSPAEHFLASAADSRYDATQDLTAFQSSSGEAYASTSYLPQDLYGYESVLSSYGAWSTVPTYGNVWFPHVSSGWRPYYHGRWGYLPRYGWTWIGTDRWAWPTHYYGRWGVTNGGAWFWIPSDTWGPAWVAWSISPEYVGWCPLGWNGRPVYSFAAIGNGGFRGVESFHGWTVVGSRHFGYYDVPRHVVDRTIILRDRPAFVTQYTAPRAPAYIIPRGGRTYTAGSSTSGRADMRGAVPRGLTGPTAAPATSPAPAPAPAYIVPNGAVRRTPEESPYDRALRVMGRRAHEPQPSSNQHDNTAGTIVVPPPAQIVVPRPNAPARTTHGGHGILRTGPPDGMSREDWRDGGGSDGRGTVAPVLQNEGGLVRPPSGMSGPPGIYAPARNQPHRGGDNGGNNGGNGGGNNNANGNSSGISGGAVHRGGGSSASQSNDSGSSGSSASSGSSGSSASSGKSSDSSSNNGSSGAVRRRP